MRAFTRIAVPRCAIAATPLATAAQRWATTTWFTKEHEWVKYDDETKIAVVGVTDVAVNELGQIMYVGPVPAGEAVETGADVADVESVKTATKVYAPVNGTIEESNSELEGSPQLLNESPEDKGWIVKIKCEALPDDLLTREAYDAFVKESSS